MVAEARRILANDRTVDVSARREAYRAEGWKEFDENAPADEVERVGDTPSDRV